MVKGEAMIKAFKKLNERLTWLERNTPYKGQVEQLESKVTALQGLFIELGLVEEYVNPIEKGTALFRLNDNYYTAKKGK
jgi:hypothetical protein